MRAVIYTRVSTTGQEKEGLSLGEQERQCRALLELHDHDLVGLYTDTGSGGGFEHRPGYRQMISELKTEWDIVYVWKLDRLNRNLKNAVMFFETLGETDTYVASVTEQVDTSSPMGRFIINVMSSLAQMEREQTKERVIMGSEAARRAGRWTGGIPYGYKIPLEYDTAGNRINRGILTEDDTESPVVQLIFDLYAKGSTISQICNELVSKRILTRKGNIIWSQNTVTAIVKRANLYIKGHNAEDEPVFTPIIGLSVQEAEAIAQRRGELAEEEE
jgi:site-specific DNA recombinase